MSAWAIGTLDGDDIRLLEVQGSLLGFESANQAQSFIDQIGDDSMLPVEIPEWQVEVWAS